MDTPGTPVGDSTRDQLLQLLRYRPRTVDELSAEVRLTPNGVRAQLAGLERDGLVERTGVRHGENPGKPPLLYRVTAAAEAAFSKAYAPALTALVGTLAERLPASALHAAFSATGRLIAASLPAPTARKEPADVAHGLLTSLGAAATVRRSGGRTVVEGAACPLADAVESCADSCEMVRALIAAATNGRITTLCDHGGAPKCRFSIG